MRVVLATAIVVSVAIPQTGAAAGTPAQTTTLERCKDSALAPELRIAACTSVIESKQVSGADLAQIYAIRGNVHFVGNNYALAIRDYDQAIALKPGWGTLTLRGMAHTKVGDYDAAISDCTRALQLFPELAMARTCLDDAQKSKAQLKAASKP